MLEANYFDVQFISPQYQNWFLNFGSPLYIFHCVLWLLNILVKAKFTFIGLFWSAVLISLVYHNCLREYCGLVDQEALEGSTISHQAIYQAWCRVFGSTPLIQIQPMSSPPVDWYAAHQSRNFEHLHFGDSTGELSCNFPSLYLLKLICGIWAATMPHKKSSSLQNMTLPHLGART